MPTGEYYGICSLAIGSGLGYLYANVYAGNSSSTLFADGSYGVVTNDTDLAAADQVVMVASYDKSTLSLTTLLLGGASNGMLRDFSHAHSFGWPSGTCEINVGGYLRSTERCYYNNIYFAQVLEGPETSAARRADIARNPYQFLVPA